MVRRISAPKLNTNVNSADGYSSFSNILQKTAAREKQSKRADEKFNFNKMNSNRNYELNKNKFDFSANKYQDKVDANATTFKSLFPEKTKDIAVGFGDRPTKKNAKKLNNTLGNMNINNFKSKKITPNYKTVETVGPDGKPVINYYNTKTGRTINTGMPVYEKPKEPNPFRDEYYQERTRKLKEDIVQKKLNNFIKSDEYINLSESDKLKAKKYIIENGVRPPILIDKSGWFGDSYKLNLTNNNPNNGKRKDGSKIDPFAIVN